MNLYRGKFTIDGLRLTDTEPIKAESEEDAEDELRKRHGSNIKNIDIEIIEDNK